MNGMKKVIYVLVGIVLLSGCNTLTTVINKNMEEKYYVGATLEEQRVVIGNYDIPLPKGEWSVIWNNYRENAMNRSDPRSANVRRSHSDVDILLKSSDSAPKFVFIHALLRVNQGFRYMNDNPCVPDRFRGESIVDKDTLYDKSCARLAKYSFERFFNKNHDAAETVSALFKGKTFQKQHYVFSHKNQNGGKISFVTYALPTTGISLDKAKNMLAQQKERVTEAF